MWIDRPTNGSQTSVYLSKKGLSFFRLKALVVQRFSNKQEQTTRPIPLWLVDFKAFDGSIWIETLESNAFDVRAKCLFILLCTIWDNWEYEKRKNLPPLWPLVRQQQFETYLAQLLKMVCFYPNFCFPSKVKLQVGCWKHLQLASAAAISSVTCKHWLLG